MKITTLKEWAKHAAAHGGILLFFIMAFEVMIMISPFAFFFYSVFNPIFQSLEQYTATRWLTAFFLPHMILPPTVPLRVLRILGSVLFVAGSLTFLVCAVQVYLSKILRWGIADKGLYRYIRHPQYLGLGAWSIGMALLWPRFIVLATLSLMFVLYYFLARNEEKRMLDQYGKPYQEYMKTTGMFLPVQIEKRLSFVDRLFPNTRFRAAVASLLAVAAIVGVGFALREVTLRSLPLQTTRNVTLVPILPEDSSLSAKVLDGIVEALCQDKEGFLRDDRDYLGYLMPADYIMQGMIADTGAHCRLHKQHNTFALMADWVLHPFEHLRRPPSAYMARIRNVDPAIARRHHCPIGIDDSALECKSCPYRRVIIVEVIHGRGKHISGHALFSFLAVRTPICYVDVDTRTGEVVNMRKVKKGTAWKDVPTPAI